MTLQQTGWILGMGILLLAVGCLPPPVDWAEGAIPQDTPIRGLAFTGVDTLVAVGGEDFTSEFIGASSDGGEVWETLPPLFGQSVLALDMGEGDQGMAVGIGGKILTTRTRGLRWDKIQAFSWSNLYGCSWVNDSLAIAVGGSGSTNGEYWRSTDGGYTWNRDTLPFELRDITFTSPLRGFMAGFSRIFRTEDGGLSWQDLPVDGDLFVSIDFPSPDTGYAVGLAGEIVRTTDGGNSWETLRSASAFIQSRKSFRKVLFRDHAHGFILGDGGIAMQTSDAGKHWRTLAPVPTENDIRAGRIDPVGRLWIGTEAGEIFRLEE